MGKLSIIILEIGVKSGNTMLSSILFISPSIYIGPMDMEGFFSEISMPIKAIFLPNQDLPLSPAVATVRESTGPFFPLFLDSPLSGNITKPSTA